MAHKGPPPPYQYQGPPAGQASNVGIHVVVINKVFHKIFIKYDVHVDVLLSSFSYIDISFRSFWGDYYVNYDRLIKQKTGTQKKC